LLRGIDPARAERVACRAIEIGALNYKSVASILANNLDMRGNAHYEPEGFARLSGRGEEVAVEVPPPTSARKIHIGALQLLCGERV
jgi:hypothetical protein